MPDKFEKMVESLKCFKEGGIFTREEVDEIDDYFLALAQRCEAGKIFDVLRYTCASEKCDNTCPAYGSKGDEKINFCGVRLEAKKVETYLKGEVKNG